MLQNRIDGPRYAKILVVPSLTSQALGQMMLRTAVGRTTIGASDSRLSRTALAVLGLMLMGVSMLYQKFAVRVKVQTGVTTEQSS